MHQTEKPGKGKTLHVHTVGNIKMYYIRKLITEGECKYLKKTLPVIGVTYITKQVTLVVHSRAMAHQESKLSVSLCNTTTSESSQQHDVTSAKQPEVNWNSIITMRTTKTRKQYGGHLHSIDSTVIAAKPLEMNWKYKLHSCKKKGKEQGRETEAGKKERESNAAEELHPGKRWTKWQRVRVYVPGWYVKSQSSSSETKQMDISKYKKGYDMQSSSDLWSSSPEPPYISPHLMNSVDMTKFIQIYPGPTEDVPALPRCTCWLSG
ncbi:hypothetical protein STEG23_013012, partial [Scotinomys teguina]